MAVEAATYDQDVPRRPVDVEQAMAQIEKGQQLAGHFPNAEALSRARRVLTGQTAVRDAYSELEAKYAPK